MSELFILINTKKIHTIWKLIFLHERFFFIHINLYEIIYLLEKNIKHFNKIFAREIQFQINLTHQELAFTYDNNVSLLAGITNAEIKYSPLSFVTSG